MLLVFAAAKAQYTPAFSQSTLNRMLLNPAHAGSLDALEINALYRSQYVAVANKAVSTQHLAFNMPIYAINSGVGLVVINDFIGYSRNTYFNVAYDYRLKLKFGTLNIGAGVGFIQSSLDGAKLRTPEGQYFSGINHNDVDVPATMQNAIAPDFSFGINLSNKKYFASVAINHIYSKLNFKSTTININRSFLVSGGYNFDLGKKITCTPTALIQTDFSRVQLQVSTFFSIYHNILTGIALRGYSNRSFDAAIMYVGATFKGFRVLYSYDINTSYLRSFNTGSHEISLQYVMPMKRKENKGNFYYNDRYL